MEILNMFSKKDDLKYSLDSSFNNDNITSDKIDKILNFNNDFDQNLSELDFFTNYQNGNENTVLNSIDNTQTILGKQTLNNQLYQYSNLNQPERKWQRP